MDLVQHVDILAYDGTYFCARITFDATAQLVCLSHTWEPLLRSFRLQLMGVVCWLAHPLGPAASVELVAKLCPLRLAAGSLTLWLQRVMQQWASER